MPIKPNVQPPAELDLFDPNFYTGGNFGLPEGNYALFFQVQMHDGFGEKKGPARLGVMIRPVSIDNPDEEIHPQFYGFGKKAHESYAPHPDTGKSIVAIPGGPGGGLQKGTNWDFFRQSLVDSGLPKGVGSNNFEELDGIWVHTVRVPEPEERKSFQSATSEAQQQKTGDGKIAVVSEILDGGKPWEGTGGVPKKGKGTVKPKVNGAPVAGKPVAVPPPVSKVNPNEAVKDAASNGLAEILGQEGNEAGMLWNKLKTAAFAHITKTYSGDMAQAVTDEFFSNDAGITMILAELGYAKTGLKVTPQ